MGSTRAAIYARVSTDDQATEGTSLDAQVDRCTHHAVAQGWDVVGPFVDRGVSGALSSRPALDEVVRLVEDGELELVVITKLDRIARSLRHLLDLLELLEHKGVSLVALDDPLDPSTASGRAMVQLRGVFAELERQLIRERTSEGQRRRVESGGWPGGPPPYGYATAVAPNQQGKVLVVDGDEAAVVRLCYRMLAEDGMTTGEVAVELNRLGTRPRAAREWTHWNVRRLLLDGRGVSGRWPWRRAGRRDRTEADEVVVSIPAILTREEHERLLAALASTSTQPTSRRRYLLRGRIFSPHGERMQGIPGHASQRWYQCPHRHTQRYTDTPRCECRRLHAATIEQAVWDHVAGLLGDPTALEALAIEAESARGEHAVAERDQLAELDAQIERLEADVAEEYAGLRAEGVDPATARAAIRASNERLLGLRDQREDLQRLRGKNLGAAGLASRLRELSARAQATLVDADETLRRKLIDLLDLHVHVLGWAPCQTCDGKGLITTTSPVRRLGNTGLVCPDCLRTRHVPAIRVSGQVPELLLLALGGGGEVTDLAPGRAGTVMPFEADVRIA